MTGLFLTEFIVLNNSSTLTPLMIFGLAIFPYLLIGLMPPALNPCAGAAHSW
jgi:hypothetical protein